MQVQRPETEAVNADSFLDIVASVVSIMLIMVMMIGMRIKNTPPDVPLSPDAAAAKTDLESERGVEESLRGDVWNVAAEIERLQQETVARGLQRDMLVTMVSALEERIRQRRTQMDGQAQAEFDLAHAASQARRQLEQVQRQRIQAETAQQRPIVVESYPTPISRTVDEHEVHFQLRAGYLAVIPLDVLIPKLKADAQRQAYKLRDLPEVTDTIGPEGGFRLRYTVERKEISPQMAVAGGRGGAYAQLKLWTLIPVSNEVGEPVDEALREGSEFRHVLSRLRPGMNAITIWVYPDSLEGFRRIRKELYRLGFAVAARPLPLDTPISGSPEGTKSAAQ